MPFAHLKRILTLDRLRLRGPKGAHDEFLLAANTYKRSPQSDWVPPDQSIWRFCFLSRSMRSKTLGALAAAKSKDFA